MGGESKVEKLKEELAKAEKEEAEHKVRTHG